MENNKWEKLVIRTCKEFIQLSGFSGKTNSKSKMVKCKRN